MENPEDKIDCRMAAIDAQIASLTKEKEELSIARRVLRSLNQHTSVSVDQPFAKPLPPPPTRSPRPGGTPSTFDMVIEFLNVEKLSDTKGLKLVDLINKIREKYWPGLVSSQIAPIIYGFVTDGRLIKSDDGYFKIANKKGDPE
jgi:hypothetical protein